MHETRLNKEEPSAATDFAGSDVEAGQHATSDPGTMSWSKDRIEEMLAQESMTYQNIELPFGLSTGGYDRSPTALKIFPQDMKGKSVLDLGCCLGYFGFEALKRGAERVVGYDMDPDNIRKARMLASCLGLPAEFRCADIEREPITEQFDFVLCLNVLHHLRNPLAVLDNLVSITRERLILEIATVGRHDRKKLLVSRLAPYFMANLPVIFVAKTGTWGRRETQKFYMTPAAIENLLIYHRGIFARLDTIPSQHKNRFLSIAHKRRIGHLLVVAGPTSAGKRTLEQKFVNNQLPQLAEWVGTPDASVWGEPFFASRQWEPSEPVRERMLFHNDFLRPYLRSTRTHERDEALDVLDAAEKISFITLWTPPEQLIEQITAADVEFRQKTGKAPSKRHQKVRELYKDPQRILKHYREWFAFTESRSKDHIVVTLKDDIEIRSIDEWESEVAAKVQTIPPVA